MKQSAGETEDLFWTMSRSWQRLKPKYSKSSWSDLIRKLRG